MNTDKINREIASLLGWTPKQISEHVTYWYLPDSGVVISLPDWTKDLNEWHKIETTDWPGGLPIWEVYSDWLWRHAAKKQTDSLIILTALNKCEAFIRAHGGDWEEFK